MIGWIFVGGAAVVTALWVLFAALLPPALARAPRLAVRSNDGGKRAAIGVVIPARNEEDYVARCVASVVAQQGVDMDVVVVDDHSTDNTRKVAEGLGVRVLSSEPRPAD